MKLKSFIIASLAVLAIAACEKPDPTPQVTQKVDLSKKSLSFEADGGNAAVNLTANCNWTAAPSEAWVSVSPVSGNGNTSVSIIVSENEGEAARDAKVSFKSEDSSSTVDLLIAQAAKPKDEPDPEPEGNNIKTLEQLQEFFGKAAEIPAEEEWNLLADIDCGGATIAPVSAFAGILDGKGHKIYNLVVESPESKAGLVLANSGVIRDLVIGSKDGQKYDGTTVIRSAAGKGGNHTGLVAENMGKLEKVINFATISFDADEGQNDPGARVGIGGMVGNSSVASEIIECVNNGNIIAAGKLTQETSLGGIIGFAQNDGIVIKDCVNAADLTLSIPVAKAFLIGGIVGRTNKEVVIEGCENKGNLVYEQVEAPATWMAIGGIGGITYNGTVVKNCKNSGRIASNIVQSCRAAGILATLNSGGRVEGCTNSGDVEIVINEAMTAKIWETAAGIVGLQEKDSKDAEGNPRRNIVTGNVNTGKIKIVVDNVCGHNNRVSAAGIIGIGCLDIDVTGNTNKGEVYLENKADCESFAGGVMALAIVTDVKMQGNVNEGAVTCKVAGDTKSYAGGIVASAGFYPGKTVDTVNVIGDRNTGAVTCANAVAAGSIAGFNVGTLTECEAGGSVNGTKVTADNLAALTQGSSSTGTASGTKLAN